MKKSCYSLFSRSQRRQLYNTYRIDKIKEINSSVYLSNDDEPLPNMFLNEFAWRDAYVPREDYHIDFSRGYLEYLAFDFMNPSRLRNINTPVLSFNAFLHIDSLRIETYRLRRILDSIMYSGICSYLYL